MKRKWEHGGIFSRVFGISLRRRSEKLLEVTFRTGSSEFCITSLVRFPSLSRFGHPLDWQGSCSADGVLRSAAHEERSGCEHVAAPNTKHLRIRQCSNTQQRIHQRFREQTWHWTHFSGNLKFLGSNPTSSVYTVDRLEAADYCVIDWWLVLWPGGGWDWLCPPEMLYHHRRRNDKLLLRGHLFLFCYIFTESRYSSCFSSEVWMFWFLIIICSSWYRNRRMAGASAQNKEDFRVTQCPEDSLAWPQTEPMK